MANMSRFLEGQLASHIFGSGTYTKPAALAVALTANTPAVTDTGTLTVGQEMPNGGAYARQSSNPSAANWLDPAVAGVTNNIPTITFPIAQSNWGWVSGLAILDSATYGAGNMLVWGTLTVPKLIGSGDQFVMRSGDLSVTWS